MTDALAAVLGGRQVETVRYGTELVLGLSGRLTLTVASDFRLGGPSGVEHFFPSLALHPTGGLLRLPGARIAEAAATAAGGLRLVFDCALTLTVPPDTAYRPWEVGGPSGSLFTALPGGYLTA
ncbi:DUF6188 family protein [Kitasatospora sp. McL0602]|uniref:DUF6188 family protein n=1 Tax=Kitasatospora sp. McL0602 TaxID=3439530 RepID=UPI003F898220